MTYPPAGFEQAADLFKVLSSSARLGLLGLLAARRMTVSELVEESGLSQPLVSQHLRVLRSSGLVTVERDGRIAHYEVADTHVTHVVDDAVAHVREHAAGPVDAR
ncbi:DNA-binding transcriptional ArsR family regulator [Clavibacter michiganensis]|uniref:ArsR/SmtB family transcription factor n=1 Tax=Clavibacter michiganensis TaxID=28447 RepID=UPI001AE8DCCF|nr:metalloregulator ArsR/SmtB family transcription factor [Clavibacter michiganensis]MBP2456518.1 DNA-binding transcriptional ArsR family regulator [Clavibacter michiganensis]MDQ0409088.1 DNA-binding transcriptional ArsR family regulator [Clavibacter michiganensis]